MINWRRIFGNRVKMFSSKPVLIPSEVSYCKMCRRKLNPVQFAIFAGYCPICDTKKAVAESAKMQEHLRKNYEKHQECENQRRQKLIDDIAEAVYFKFGATSDGLISQRMLDGATLIIRNSLVHDEAFKKIRIRVIAELLKIKYAEPVINMPEEIAEEILVKLFF